MRYVLLSLLLIAIVLCCSCGGNSSTPTTTTQQERGAASITITPSSAALAPGGVQQFAATVVGIANTTVVWSIQEGATGGAIDANGKYTAPTTAGTFHVIGQSLATPSLSASATVTVAITGNAKGLYASTGLAAYIIVLPDDMFYAIDGPVAADGSMTNVFRLISGQGQSSAGNYTAALTFFLMDYTFSGNVQAAYVPGTSMTGSYNPPVQQFNAKVVPASQFNFNLPANLSEIAGAWSGLFIGDILLDERSPGAIMISATGQITSPGAGCSYSGTVTPDANKNFFNVTITFGPAPCNPANQTISGVAVDMLLPNGATRQLLIVMRQSTFGFASLR